jgi:membrane glycosyltransferase
MFCLEARHLPQQLRQPIIMPFCLTDLCRVFQSKKALENKMLSKA